MTPRYVLYTFEKTKTQKDLKEKLIGNEKKFLDVKSHVFTKN